MNALVITFFAVVAIVAAAPASPPRSEAHDEPIAILSQTSNVYPDGRWDSGYETANGISASEEGIPQRDGDDEVIVVKGVISYTAPDGTKIDMAWTADQDGFHPSGEHLPTPPPIPEAILKALEWNAAHPHEEEEEEKKYLSKKF